MAMKAERAMTFCMIFLDSVWSWIRVHRAVADFVCLMQ
jgi:hypothetical protein